MNINKTSSGGWFGLDGLEEKAKSGWGSRGGRVVWVIVWLGWLRWLGWMAWLGWSR